MVMVLLFWRMLFIEFLIILLLLDVVVVLFGDYLWVYFGQISSVLFLQVYLELYWGQGGSVFMVFFFQQGDENCRLYRVFCFFVELFQSFLVFGVLMVGLEKLRVFFLLKCMVLNRFLVSLFFIMQGMFWVGVLLFRFQVWWKVEKVEMVSGMFIICLLKCGILLVWLLMLLVRGWLLMLRLRVMLLYLIGLLLGFCICSLIMKCIFMFCFGRGFRLIRLICNGLCWLKVLQVFNRMFRYRVGSRWLRFVGRCMGFFFWVECVFMVLQLLEFVVQLIWLC